MICPQCGATIKDGMKFCSKCGSKMNPPGIPVAGASKNLDIKQKILAAPNQHAVNKAHSVSKDSTLTLKPSKISPVKKNYSNFKWALAALTFIGLIISAYAFGGDTNGLAMWIGMYLIEAAIWFWIVYLGGAYWLEGSFLSAIFISFLAPRWNSDGIRLFSWMIFIIQTIYFVIGLYEPSMRM